MTPVAPRGRVDSSIHRPTDEPRGLSPSMILEGFYLFFPQTNPSGGPRSRPVVTCEVFWSQKVYKGYLCILKILIVL